jgi:hypothetical protein
MIARARAALRPGQHIQASDYLVRFRESIVSARGFYLVDPDFPGLLSDYCTLNANFNSVSSRKCNLACAQLPLLSSWAR